MKKNVPIFLLFCSVLISAQAQLPEFDGYFPDVSFPEGFGEWLNPDQASGTQPITYQWQKDGVNIPGTTDFKYWMIFQCRLPLLFDMTLRVEPVNKILDANYQDGLSRAGCHRLSAKAFEPLSLIPNQIIQL